MTDGTLAFDGAVLESAADRHATDSEALAAVLETLQAAAERHIGVDGLVYDWRNAFPEDPVLERRPDAYELVVDPRVWREFGERCGFEDDTLRAVMAVHAEQVKHNAEQRGDGPLPVGEPMLLVRGRGRS